MYPERKTGDCPIEEETGEVTSSFTGQRNRWRFFSARELPVVSEMMMRRLAIAIALSLAGCTSVTTITDVPPEGPLIQGAVVEHDGRTLFITVEQTPGLNLARITPLRYQNGVYLGTQYISSGGGGRQTFEVSLDRLELPRDWKDHVYWIAGGSWDNLWQLMRHRGPLPQRVERTRIELRRRTQPSHATDG